MNTIHRIYSNPFVRLLVIDGIMLTSIGLMYAGYHWHGSFVLALIAILIIGDIFMEGRMQAQRQKRFDDIIKVQQQNGVFIVYRQIGEHRYIFIYDNEGRVEALRTLGKFYRDPQYGIPEDEAIKLSMAMQRDEECCGK